MLFGIGVPDPSSEQFVLLLLLARSCRSGMSANSSLLGGKADNICSMRVLRIFLSLDIMLDPFGETVICLFLLVASRKNAKVCH